MGSPNLYKLVFKCWDLCSTCTAHVLTESLRSGHDTDFYFPRVSERVG